MAVLDMLRGINETVRDVISLDFQVVKAQSHYVPGYEDTGLSFERGKAKRSKIIHTCVLYADIRNSTTLSHQHSYETMARLYTAFTKSILRLAEHHEAVVRNIIGDRVMLLFPESNCFTKAVDTAISINTVSKHIIDKHFKGLNFEVGIGIDYGEMLVVKAGIPKREPERTNYKNLIWIGKPANIASKLTDIASKAADQTIFKVQFHPYNIANQFLRGYGLLRNPNSSLYANYIKEDVISEIEFAKKINYDDKLGITYSGGKFLKFDKDIATTKNPPILMSEIVYTEFKSQNPLRRHDLYGDLKVEIKDYKGKIYGGDVIWTDYTKV